MKRRNPFLKFIRNFI